MSLIDVIFKKNALPKVPASLKELVGEIRGIKTAIADLWRSMTNAEGNINRLDEAVEADENTLGDIVKHKVYLTGSTLNQSMMSKENTIYVVKDDLTLSENVTVPENCVLEFEGGSINGAHTLTGQGTGIQAGLVKVFSTDVTLAGSFSPFGDTSGRPSPQYNMELQKGLQYFDTTLGKPIWWNGTAWVDATGATV